MKKYTFYMDDDEVDRLINQELTEILQVIEADDPKHPDDIAWRKEMIPALKTVIEAYE